MAGRGHTTRESAWLALSLVVLGIAVGALTVVLSLAVDGAAATFAEHPHLVWLLPVAGFASYGIYRILRLDYAWSTAQVMEAVHSGQPVPVPLAAAIIAGTSLTVLCGGSVGKEAAALQMGAAISGLFHRKAIDSCRGLLSRAAMAAALGAMLGAPLAGVVFSFESLAEKPRSVRSAAAPLISAFAAWGVTKIAGVSFLNLPELPISCAVGGEAVGFAVAIGACSGLLAALFCRALGALRKGLASLGAPVFALAVGGVATALIVGYADLFHYEGLRAYCGTGVAQIEAALLGEPLPWSAFLVKMALTLLTLAGGFKGGEIMPVFTIGACLGSTMAAIAEAFCPAGTAGLRVMLVEMGAISFFAACTNCPLTALVLCCEIFGPGSVLFAAAPAFIAFLISRSSSLYPTTIAAIGGERASLDR